MAARENQGHLIAVIILVLITLVLALAAFVGWSKAWENGDLLEEEQTKQLASSELAAAQYSAIEALKAMAGGFGSNTTEIQDNIDNIENIATSNKIEVALRKPIEDLRDSIKSIKETYDKDMAGSRTADGEQATNATWRSTIDSNNKVIAAKNSELAIQRNETRQSKKEAEEKIANMAKLLATANTTAEDANKKYEKSESEKLAARRSYTEDINKANTDIKARNDAFAELKTKKDKEIRDVTKMFNDEKEESEKLKTRINRYEREVFDHPDGTVKHVAARLKTVTIDLGSADGLTNNRTFAIYDQAVTNFEKGEHKATIEVTKVFKFHAEARIEDENITDPILPGDHVLTATWDPGFSVAIALAGRFDLDGDIYDDTEKLIGMIERNGGKVVAWHDAEGNRQGKIDPSIRYLVKGEAPQSGVKGDKKPEAARAIVIAMQDMEKEADANTIQKINLQKLLNRMGVRARPKILQIGLPRSGFKPAPERTPEKSSTLKDEEK